MFTLFSGDIEVNACSLQAVSFLLFHSTLRQSWTDSEASEGRAQPTSFKGE